MPLPKVGGRTSLLILALTWKGSLTILPWQNVFQMLWKVEKALLGQYSGLSVKKKKHSDCASKDYHMAVKLSATRRWLRLSQS